MLGRLRRSRLLCVLILGLTPGIGGLAVPVLHPCPVDAPWMASPVADHSQHSTTGDSQETGHHGGFCHCPGACNVAGPAAPPLGGPALATWIASTVAAAPWAAAAAHPSSSQIRQPPALAPPLA